MCPGDVLAASLISIGLGGLIGAYLVWTAGWPVLALGVLGALTGFFYSAPPLKLGYRGLGELFVFLDFGLLPVLGVYYVQVRAFASSAGVAGASVGLMMANVLWINQFQDADADAAVGKRHWVVRLGRRRAVIVHTALFVLAYGLVVAGISLRLLPPLSWLAFLSAPIAAFAAVVASRRWNRLDKLRPANAATIAAHVTMSLLLATGLAGSPRA